jgi:hypothetical protein
MADDELRDRMMAWSRSFDRLVPPDLPELRRRVRRRVIRQAMTGATLFAAAGVAAALVLTNVAPRQGGIPVTGPSTPVPSTSAPGLAGVKATARVPYYLTTTVGVHPAATIRRTATGKLVATVRAPAGQGFIAVTAAGQGHRSFILAARTVSHSNGQVRFFKLSLHRDGQPGPLRLTKVPVMSLRMKDGCWPELAGLALTPDGRTIAISTLSNCVTGRAGPSLIAIVSLASGTFVHVIRPGRDYPLSLSWTAGGTLVYGWRQGVWAVAGAASPGSGTPKPRRLISPTAGIETLDGASDSMVSPDGSVVLATVGRGTLLAVAEFSARTGKALRIILPGGHNPDAYCGPLWTSHNASHLLAACGDGQEQSLDNGQATVLNSPWKLPTYPVPGPPQIAW